MVSPLLCFLCLLKIWGGGEECLKSAEESVCGTHCVCCLCDLGIQTSITWNEPLSKEREFDCFALPWQCRGLPVSFPSTIIPLSSLTIHSMKT